MSSGTVTLQKLRMLHNNTNNCQHKIPVSDAFTDVQSNHTTSFTQNPNTTNVNYDLSHIYARTQYTFHPTQYTSTLPTASVNTLFSNVIWYYHIPIAPYVAQ